MSEDEAKSNRPYYSNVFPPNDPRHRQRFVKGGSLEDDFRESASKRTKLSESDSSSFQTSSNVAEFYESVVNGPSEKEEAPKRKSRVPQGTFEASGESSGGRKAFYCQVCDIWADSQTNHCGSSGHMLAIAMQRSEAPIPSYGIPQTNKGYQILRDKMNWRQDKGLGREEQGRLFPIPTAVKLSRTGLGAETEGEKKTRITHLTDPKTAGPIVEEPTAAPDASKPAPLPHRSRQIIDQEHLDNRRKEAEIRRVVRSDNDLLEQGLI